MWGHHSPLLSQTIWLHPWSGLLGLSNHKTLPSIRRRALRGTHGVLARLVGEASTGQRLGRGLEAQVQSLLLLQTPPQNLGCSLSLSFPICGMEVTCDQL